MLVLDANILIRAVLGRRARTVITTYGNTVEFFAPDVAFAEAREHLPKVLAKRRIPAESGLALLVSLGEVIQAVDFETYSASEEEARKRLLGRDPDDWPILATALVLNCPIWTEDADFFGAGIATWTTDRVEMFLQGVGRGVEVAFSGMHDPAESLALAAKTCQALRDRRERHGRERHVRRALQYR